MFKEGDSVISIIKDRQYLKYGESYIVIDSSDLLFGDINYILLKVKIGDSYWYNWYNVDGFVLLTEYRKQKINKLKMSIRVNNI